MIRLPVMLLAALALLGAGASAQTGLEPAPALAAGSVSGPANLLEADPAPLMSPAPGAGEQGGALDALRGLGARIGLVDEQPEFLDPAVAFVLDARAVRDASGDPQIVARWEIADGYYLYRERMGFALEGAAAGSVLGAARFPAGKRKYDEYFGDMEVYYGGVEARLPLTVPAGAPMPVLLVTYQGCADAGLCYPPITRSVALQIPAASADGAAPARGAVAGAGYVAEQDRLARLLAGASLWVALPTFFVLGLGLAFTPCVLPMVPILSGIIVGQKQPVGAHRGFVLSLVYVLPMALTYTAAGVAAGLTGANLQIVFQDPWVIGTFAAVFVLLALAMFGLYDLQVPPALQARLGALSNRRQGGTYLGVAAMGLFSALIVGPCVAAPLIGVLLYIAQSGDALAGGAALFALSLGMGTPLLAVGASAGRLVPPSGPWTIAVKACFGVLMLGVAVWLLDRVVPGWVTLLLAAALLIFTAIYLGALDTLSPGVPGWRRFAKGAGLVMLVHGVLLMVGAAAGGQDVLQPLRGVAALDPAAPQETALPFRRVKGVAGLSSALRAAAAARQPVMLDYYADWCVSCKEMERFTFADRAVREALAGVVLLQTDVTANDAADRGLLDAHGIYGPPAILFFGPDGVERDRFRVMGFMDAGRFAQVVRAATGVAGRPAAAPGQAATTAASPAGAG